MGDDYLQNHRGGEVWRVAKFTNPRAGATVEVLTGRVGKEANPIAEEEVMLRGESFLQNDGDQYYELPPAAQAHERITEQSVERARFTRLGRKAPGSDKLSFGAIRLLWKWNRMRLVGLMKAAVQTGRHPAVWKRASRMVIQKPGNENYMKLKSYRTISLLSCMGKVVEKVVAELLSDEAGRGALLSNGQFVSRKKRSAINTAAIMVDIVHAAWMEDNITGVLQINIKAAFPMVAREWLIPGMKAKKIDGDLIRWTESLLSERKVAIVTKGNLIQSDPMEAGLPQVLPVSLIFFAIHTAGLIMRVEERVEAEGRSFPDDLVWVPIWREVNQVVEKPEACAAESIEWASRRDLQFDTANTKAALVTPRNGHKTHLRAKLTAKIKLRNSFIRFHKEVTRWLGISMDAHLTFMEDHNRCMRNTRAAEARLRTLSTMHGIVPEWVRVAQIACVQAVTLYRTEFWWDPQEIGRQENHQLLLNWQATSTLRALPTTPMGVFMRESGLTAAPAALDARQQAFTARLASAYECSKLQAAHGHPTSGAPICRLIFKQHERHRDAETMRWPNPDQEPAGWTVILYTDTAPKREAIRWARDREAMVGAGVGLWRTDRLQSDNGRGGAAAVCKH